jgi:predicted TIM-barrel fold metal-dependent hydrolase
MTYTLHGMVDPVNAWRLETPGSEEWEGSPYGGAENKYFMCSADTHVNEPGPELAKRIDRRYRDNLPRFEVIDGEKWVIVNGRRSAKVTQSEGGPEDLYREQAGYSLEDRIRDEDHEGVDAEIIFPTKGVFAYATRDPEYAFQVARAYNDWVWEFFEDYRDRFIPMASVPTLDVDRAVQEVYWAKEKGYKGINCPCKPMFGPEQRGDLNYNLPAFDPFWSAVVETGLALTFHIGSARAPQIASKDGGAIINFIWGSQAPSISTVLHLCTCGVFDRFPELKFGIIEAGAGWVPWLLNYMDSTYKKHHMWVNPKLKHAPSEYFRNHGFVSMEEDDVIGRMIEELELENNFMWANDYPHSEGTFPHSAQAIERMMGGWREETRRKVLGENFARFMGIEIPEKYRQIRPSGG